MNERKRAAAEYASKQLFTASEHIREALDTIDLEGLSIKAETIDELEKARTKAEKTAQRLQREAKEAKR